MFFRVLSLCFCSDIERVQVQKLFDSISNVQTTFSKDCGILFLHNSVSYSLSTVLYSFFQSLSLSFCLFLSLNEMELYSLRKKRQQGRCRTFKKLCKNTLTHTPLVFSEHDECVRGLNTCDENALCFNTVGGHSCSCKPGYIGNGTICSGKGKHLCTSLCITVDIHNSCSIAFFRYAIDWSVTMQSG